MRYPLPFPYDDNTPQDHVDMLRDHADLQIDTPLLDYAAVAAADLIEQQAAEIKQLRLAAQAVAS
jgi:hypothetical protein